MPSRASWPPGLLRANSVLEGGGSEPRLRQWKGPKFHSSICARKFIITRHTAAYLWPAWSSCCPGRLPIDSMRVLAIDASLRNTGVAVIEANGGKPRALYYGVIHNATTLRSSSCLVAIRDRLAELIHTHEPDCCALEAVIYVQSYKTAILLGAARGAAILAAAERGLPVFEYAPKRIKQATVGRGSADKNQVAFMIRALLGLTETPTADAADALAIGLTHLRAQEAARLGVPTGARI
jgi:crossover junction endodeoxyribonuclease RuvC